MRILLVEDNDMVADATKRGLTVAQFVVDRVASAESAQILLATQDFDLAIIDIGLPGLDGLDLVRHLRKSGKAIPTLILTARDTLNDKVKALDLGADDFLSKPFEPAELLARCRALIRRASATVNGAVNLGRMKIDLIGKQLQIDGREVELTSREWLVLECLTKHIGRVVPKDRLLQAVTNMDEDVSANAVEVYVSRLRSKLGDAAIIRGLRGLGYRLEELKPS